MSALHCVVVLMACLVLVACYDVAGTPRRRRDVFMFKRDIVGKRGFTPEEQQEILDLHNKYRREVEATNMRIMVWDDSLTSLAQNWSDRCDWRHSSSTYRRLPPFGYIGENLYVRTDNPTALQTVDGWGYEKDFYNYSTGECTRVCGHYTQLVWANSYALGCGIRYCSSVQNLNWDRSYLVVCHYGPGGNYRGVKPYSGGQPACSACSEDFPYCIQGLCSKTKEIVRDSSSTTLDLQFSRYIPVVALLHFLL